MAAVFYDHAKNMLNSAEAEAIAKIRREVLAAGKSYKVKANWPGSGRFYWNGGYYDVLRLAKSLVWNNAENVEMIGPNGAVDIKAARY
jgi:hypothetical protein